MRTPRKGYVTHHLDQAPLNDGNVDVYLCGPPQMVDSALTFFREKYIEPEGVY